VNQPEQAAGRSPRRCKPSSTSHQGDQPAFGRYAGLWSQRRNV